MSKKRSIVPKAMVDAINDQDRRDQSFWNWWVALWGDIDDAYEDMEEEQESSALGIEEPDYTPPIPTLTLPVPLRRTMDEFCDWMDRRGRT